MSEVAEKVKAVKIPKSIRSLTDEQKDAIIKQLQEEKEFKKTFGNQIRDYEEKRNALVVQLCESAKTKEEELTAYKKDVFRKLFDFRELKTSVGNLRKNSKGGYSVKSDDGRYKVAFKFNTSMGYDDLADNAAALIMEFIEDNTAKVPEKIKSILKSYLNKKGKKEEFDYEMISKLYKLEDEMNDPKFSQACKLFREAYSPQHTTVQAYFFERIGDSKHYKRILQDFAQIHISTQK